MSARLASPSRLRVAALAASLAGLLAAPAALAETLPTNLAISGDARDAASRFVMRHRRQLGAAAATLVVRGETPLRGGRVVRISQRYAGLPVLDADVAVTILGGRLIAASGRLRPISSFAGPAKLDRAAASAALRGKLATARVTAARQAIEVRGGKARVVWELAAISWKPYDTWAVRVDARTGKVLSGLSTRRHGQAKALAYIPNPQVGKLSVVTLRRLYELTKLAGPYVDVQRCGASQSNLECERLATFDRQNDYLFHGPDEPTVGDAFSETHTYYHVDAFHRWMAESFGFRRKGKQQIKVYVNFHFLGGDGQRYGMANAFFGDIDGDNEGDLVFGQSQRDFAYDGDVVYHEFTHSAVDETSNLTSFFDDLGYNSFPLALNEAFADLLSCAYAGDGAVGEYAGGAYANGAIRDLEGEVRTCDDLIAQSHRDGVIWGRLNWTIRNKVAAAGLDVKRFDGVIYKVMAGLSQSADFVDAAKLLLAVAKAEDAAIGKLAQAEVEARGLLTCARILELKPESPRFGYMLGTSSIIGLDYVPAGLQYRVVAPAGATSMTLGLAGTANSGNSGRFLGAFIRKGAPISFTGSEPQRDFTMDSTKNEYTLELDNAERPLEPGATYYVLPLNVSEQQLGYELSVSFASSTKTPDASAPTPDAGVGDLGGGDASSSNRATGGGGCAVAPSSSAPAGLGLSLLLLFALALVRRR